MSKDKEVLAKVVIHMSEYDFVQLSISHPDLVEKVANAYSLQKRDIDSIKSIKKAIKKLDLATIANIARHTGMGLVKVRRLLHDYTDVYWLEFRHQGQGKETKKYKRIKKEK